MAYARALAYGSYGGAIHAVSGAIASKPLAGPSSAPADSPLRRWAPEPRYVPVWAGILVPQPSMRPATGARLARSRRRVEGKFARILHDYYTQV